MLVTSFICLILLYSLFALVGFKSELEINQVSYIILLMLVAFPLFTIAKLLFGF